MGDGKEEEREEIEDVRAWLGGSARNKSLQHLRSKTRREKREEAMECQIDPVETPVDIIASGERTQILREAIASLPSEHAELLKLKYGKGLSYAEIGSAMGLGKDTVTNRLRAARHHLRAALRDGDEFSHK